MNKWWYLFGVVASGIVCSGCENESPKPGIIPTDSSFVDVKQEEDLPFNRHFDTFKIPDLVKVQDVPVRPLDVGGDGQTPELPGIDSQLYDADSFSDVSEDGEFPELPGADSVSDVGLDSSSPELPGIDSVSDLSQDTIADIVLNLDCVASFDFNDASLDDVCNGMSLIDNETSIVPSEQGFGQARYFNGVSSLALYEDPMLNITDGLVVDVMVKPDFSSLSYSGSFGNIVTKAVDADGAKQGYMITVREGNTLSASVGLGDKWSEIFSDFELPAGEFTRVRMLYSSQHGFMLFANDDLVGSKTFEGPINYSTQDKTLYLGWNGGNGFIGALDEINISKLGL
jgi:hypothetical protein